MIDSQVKIVDLGEEARRNNECIILHVHGPEFTSKLVMKCDGFVPGADGFDWGSDW